jgi:PBP1b-binding outer membrane lipoprotein LpoB
MKKLAIAAAVALLVGGCAHKNPSNPQVNRAAKADKYTAPKQAAKAVMPTPNQVVKKRWMPKFKIKWLHK